MDASSHNSTGIEITILDVNDNYPVFRHQQYNISINETIPVGRSILTVIADDADEVCMLYCAILFLLFLFKLCTWTIVRKSYIEVVNHT